MSKNGVYMIVNLLVSGMIRMVEVVAGGGHLREIAADWVVITNSAFVVPTCEGEGAGDGRDDSTLPATWRLKIDSPSIPDNFRLPLGYPRSDQFVVRSLSLSGGVSERGAWCGGTLFYMSIESLPLEEKLNWPCGCCALSV